MGVQRTPMMGPGHLDPDRDGTPDFESSESESSISVVVELCGYVCRLVTHGYSGHNKGARHTVVEAVKRVHIFE